MRDASLRVLTSAIILHLRVCVYVRGRKASHVDPAVRLAVRCSVASEARTLLHRYVRDVDRRHACCSFLGYIVVGEKCVYTYVARIIFKSDRNVAVSR